MEYLTLAALTHHYDNLVVTDNTGDVFLRIEGEAPRGP